MPKSLLVPTSVKKQSTYQVLKVDHDQKTKEKTDTADKQKPQNDKKFPTYDDIIAATENLKGYAHKTNVTTSETINEELTQLAKEYQDLTEEEATKQISVFFKCENL